jgi:hypothetical protein
VLGGTTVTLGSFSAELRSVDAQDGTSGEIVSFTDTDGDGAWTASFGTVVPGDYTLQLRGPAGLNFTTQPTFPLSVDVGTGHDFETSIMLTAVSAGS